MTAPAPSRNSLLRFLAVTALLAALLPATFAIGALVEWRVRASADEIGARKVEATVAAAQARMTRLLASMAEDGQALARNAVVRQVLGDPATRTPTLVRPVLEAVAGTESLYRRAPTEAIELYRPDGALFAWSGFEAPLDRWTAREGMPDTLRTAIALDGPGRRTITVWVPIRRDDELIGVARVMRRAVVAVPVRNEFLQDYNLVDGWQNDAPLPFSIVFADALPREPAANWLTGTDGTVLGRIDIVQPDTDALLSGTRASVSAIAAFWALVLSLWLLAGSWFAADKRLHEAALASTGSRNWGVSSGLFLIWGLGWWALRVGLLRFNLPDQWWATWRSGASLFNPSFVRSDFGWGVLGSAGDVIVTTLFAVVFALAALRVALIRIAAAIRSPDSQRSRLWLPQAALFLAAGAASILAYTVGARHTVLNTTLRYFERSGPVPAPLTFVVLMALVAGAYAAISFASTCGLMAGVVSGRIRPVRRGVWQLFLAIAGLMIVALAGTGSIGGTPGWVPIVLFVATSAAGALFLLGARERWAWPLTFRGMLFCVLVLVPQVYVIMSSAVRERENIQIEAAAADFALGRDPRTVFAIEQVLTEARSNDLREELIEAVRLFNEPSSAPDTSRIDTARVNLDTDAALIAHPDSSRLVLDDLITRLVSGSLLASLADYLVDMAVIDANGDTLATYTGEAGVDTGSRRPARVGKEDPLAFDVLERLYVEEAPPGLLVVHAPVGSQRGTHRYAGIGPVQAPGEPVIGWLYARATPRLQRPAGETPYPSVLVPASSPGVVASEMSFSEYDGGVLVRSRGVAAGPFQLDVSVRSAFAGSTTEHWRTEVLEGVPYRAYYQRMPADEKAERLDAVAVRLQLPSLFDHLFNLLRITVVGLVLGLLVYGAGLPIRARTGLLAESRTRFGDRVLSRFLLVGILTVAVTGVIGRSVILEQNQQSVENLLKSRLQLADAAVTADAGPGTSVASVLELARADKASAQLGLDLHVYLGYRLVSTSRRQLVRQRFIDERLPADVYQKLFAEGRRYAFTEGHIGTFTYTIGYKAISDEFGRTVGAVAVPTLPEQATIQAGQARMIAYLFGVLLVLMLGIFVTTALLAEQLTRPFKRLQEGFKAVGEGQSFKPIPVETKDEVGQLAEAFNAMQGQLDESRARLARQERELAWREMAQQVAHEIKNPLTPMKLSVQHLRRAHKHPGESASPHERRFGSTLERITTTLVEQIDALSRIADEFSTFGRLPRRKVARLDLNVVIREAAALFEDEAPARNDVTMDVRLADEPLFVIADHEELRRVYINLLTNALQALDGASGGRIEVATSRAADAAISCVSDNGTGISDDVRPRIFQPNFSTKNSGTGLGLAIVKKTVEAGGGSISFATESGKGTAFTIRLPLAEAADEV